MNHYPHVAGAKEETTSREAADKIEGSGKAATLRLRVLRCFDMGSYSSDEIAQILSESPFSIRPRITELLKTGQIERTGQRRVSSNGYMSHVFCRVR